MSRDDQANAIWRALGLSLINEQFTRYVRAVMNLATLAFDDVLLQPGRIEAVTEWTPRHWALFKGELEFAVRDSGIDLQAQAEWLTAFEAVYRIAGCADVAPDYRGVL